MTAQELRSLVRSMGIVGAGGAGFPTYMKIDTRANTILMNCAECEPLLKLHRQLLALHTREIVETFSLLADVLGADEAIIGIKEEYHATIEALEEVIPSFPKVRLQLLPGLYPMGDEVVLIYEATGRVVNPGGLPIEEGIGVFNVETVYNIHRAIAGGHPVNDKLVTVVGEVKNPITVRVPIGTPMRDVVAMAGGASIAEPVYFVGGPMMGNIKKPYDPVMKTTNAILVLPREHMLVQHKTMPASIGMKRAASSCCHCHACTDLCPRYNLGHPIEPHRFMRAMSNHDYKDIETFLDLFFCCGCGICELFACPQGLSPRSLIADCKNGLRKAGITPPKGVCAAPVEEARKYRKLPEKRLEARLGLSKYDSEAPLDDRLRQVKEVKILLSQHIGTPALAQVQTGCEVEEGQVIGAAAEGLSVPIHASIKGRVAEVTDTFIRILA